MLPSYPIVRKDESIVENYHGVQVSIFYYMNDLPEHKNNVFNSFLFTCYINTIVKMLKLIRNCIRFLILTNGWKTLTQQKLRILLTKKML